METNTKTFECPNEAAHDRFTVEVRITEEWVIDQRGRQTEVGDSPNYTIDDVDSYEFVHCAVCGAAAIDHTSDDEEDQSEEEVADDQD
jgi:hypothetical protein